VSCWTFLKAREVKGVAVSERRVEMRLKRRVEWGGSMGSSCHRMKRPSSAMEPRRGPVRGPFHFTWGLLQWVDMYYLVVSHGRIVGFRDRGNFCSGNRLFHRWDGRTYIDDFGVVGAPGVDQDPVLFFAVPDFELVVGGGGDHAVAVEVDVDG